MSDLESTPEPVPAAVPKQKVKRNISEEERARRSAAMKEISAKRLAAIRKDKPAPVPDPPAPAPVPTPVVAVDDDDDDVIIDRIVQRLKKSSKSKKTLIVEPESESDEEIVKAPAKKAPKAKAPPKPRAPRAPRAAPAAPPEPVYEPPRRSICFF